MVIILSVIFIWRTEVNANSVQSVNGLRGEYFDSIDLTNPILTRNDATIDFKWGDGTPDASIESDTFSVRWTGYVVPKYSESYQFHMYADDGIRLWVNNQIVIDKWVDQNIEHSSIPIYLTAGTKNEIRVEYYENFGVANVMLQWSSNSQAKEIVPHAQLYILDQLNGTGLRGEYYNDINLKNLKLTRTDAKVDFSWQDSSPSPLLENDTFSVLWTGYVAPNFTDTYTFYMASDDGVRIWVNNQLILDKWEDQFGEFTSIPIQLIAGQRYDIRVEYFENRGLATAALKWSSQKQVKEVVPQSALFPPDKGFGTGLKGEYYHNVDLTNLEFSRTDAVIDFSWEASSPSPLIDSDTFSAVWTGFVVPKFTDTYTFYMASDDGVRVWVNNQLILNRWKDQASEFASVPIQLNADQRYDIRVEYYENQGVATAALKWSSSKQSKEVIPQSALYPPDRVSGTGLKGEYYNDRDLKELRLTRQDKNIDFSWTEFSPIADMEADTFSARWTGQIVPEITDDYTFYMLSDDGVRIWVDNELLLDKWEDNNIEHASTPIRLTAGERYDIRIEYFENFGHATAILKWSSPSVNKSVIPQSALNYPVSYKKEIGATRYVYDAQGKLISVENKNGEVINYYYDANGNLISVRK